MSTSSSGSTGLPLGLPLTPRCHRVSSGKRSSKMSSPKYSSASLAARWVIFVFRGIRAFFPQTWDVSERSTVFLQSLALTQKFGLSTCPALG